MMSDDENVPTTPPTHEDDPSRVLGDDELRARGEAPGGDAGSDPPDDSGRDLLGAVRDDPLAALRDGPLASLRDGPLASLRDDPLAPLRDGPLASLRDDPLASLRDDDPGNDVLEGAAIAFSLALGVARVVSGLVEVLFPKLFLRVVGHRGAATDGAAVGFRMKGGRDLAIGLGTLAAATNGDREGVANMTVLGVVIDAIDGFAVSRDRGRSLRRPVQPTGATVGYVVAVGAGIAAAVLRRPSGGRR